MSGIDSNNDCYEDWRAGLPTPDEKISPNFKGKVTFFPQIFLNPRKFPKFRVIFIKNVMILEGFEELFHIVNIASLCIYVLCRYDKNVQIRIRYDIHMVC